MRKAISGLHSFSILRSRAILLILFFAVACGVSLSAQRISTTSLYLEPERILVSSDVRFPQAVSFDGRIYLWYQKVFLTGSSSTQSIAYRSSADGRVWSDEVILEESIPLASDDIPPIYSVAANTGFLSVAVSRESDSILVYELRAGSETWSRDQVSGQGRELINPRLFASRNGFMLFASQRRSQTQTGLQQLYPDIVYGYRSNAGSFSGMDVLPVQEDQEDVSNPSFLEYRGEFLVAYENRRLVTGRGITSQVYLLRSSDNGQSWAAPLQLSNFVDFGDAGNADVGQDDYENQNPRLHLGSDGRPLLLMDRNRFGRNSRVSLTRLDNDFLPQSDALGSFNSYLSQESRASSGSDFFIHRGTEFVLYFFDVSGSSQVFVAWEDGARGWRSSRLDNGTNPAYLPVRLSHSGDQHFFWLQARSVVGGESSLAYRQPDIGVLPPAVSALSYTPGEPSGEEEVIFRVNAPEDPAGIQTLRYSWVPGEELVPGSLRPLSSESILNLRADRHGTWTLFLQTEDRAGNRSEFRRISYELDIVPPAPVRFDDVPLDDEGFLLSNSTDITWTASEEDDFAGYRVFLRYLGVASMDPPSEGEYISLVNQSLASAAAGIRQQNRLTLNNEDNGLWALGVQAVDRVGNASEASIRLLPLNKYVPVTIVSFVQVRSNIIGQREISISGRGFLADGRIERVIFDRDGQEPWDFELTREANDFRIVSDRQIQGISLDSIRSGSYAIFLDHSSRGRYRYGRSLSLESSGAVKLGDYRVFTPPEVLVASGENFTLNAGTLGLGGLMLLMTLALGVSLFRIRSIIKDSRLLYSEVTALVEGRSSITREEFADSMKALQKRGMGLRDKFTIFMLLLVIAVVSVVALPLSSYILRSQQQTLARGLVERITVMTESISTGASTILQSNSANDIVVGLAQLRNQVSAMEEIEYITITSKPRPGRNDLDPAGREYIWTSNDPLLTSSAQERRELMLQVDERFRDTEYFRRGIRGLESVESPAQQGAEQEILLQPGVDVIDDALSSIISDELIPRFTAAAADPEISALLEDLNRTLVGRSGATLQELEQLQQTETLLRSRLLQLLDPYLILGSLPEFSSDNYDLNSQYYSFYYPIYELQNDFTPAYLGTVRLGISTESINTEIINTRRTILIQVGIFAAIALGAGIIGAFLLASITVNPIRQLVAGVERIRDAEVKAELKDKPIKIRTRDELNFLSETINQMTEGLIKAESANKSLMLGKDVQKMFITLDPNPHDAKTKATTRHEVTDYVEFFGYYEGAKGVSGDYYFYQKIDDRKYAMIKCDVSGKDIEAALIMVTVATLFLQHFDNWQEKQLQQRRIAHALKQPAGGQKVLSDLATNINEIIYAREFKGKFAAFNMLTLDEQSGEITFCNAGDNIVHMYRRSERKVVRLDLANTPAAGAISERVMGMPINFPEETARLEKGDILLLFTDGYEEARRYIRHPDWSVYQESEFEGDEGRKRLEALEEELKPFIMGQDEGGIGEAFSIARIHDVVEAVMNRQIYRLTKYRNPVENEELVFDFTRINPSLPNLVLALMSVEKVFRLVPLPGLTHEHRINVDKKINDFLREYFLQYQSYFHHPLPEDEKSLYLRFSHLSEDSQYDDLTILAVEKK